MFSLAILPTSILTLASAVTAAISAATGMGGGVLLLIVMSIFMPLGTAIPLHGVVQMKGNLYRTWLLRKHLLWRIIAPFIIGAVLGVLTVVLFFKNVARNDATKTVPCIILFILINYTVFKPRHIPHFKIRDKAFALVGYITGILGIIVGAVDPFISLFFLRDDMSKEEMVVNKSFMQAIIHTMKLPVFIFLGFNYLDHIPLLLLLIAAGFLGTYAGIWVLNKLKTGVFNFIVRVILFLSGVKIFFDLVKYGNL